MLLSLKKFERCQMSYHLKGIWQEAVKNIGEYWFGIPSVPRMADDLPMLPLTNEGIRECLL